MYAQMVDTGVASLRAVEELSPEEQAFQQRIDADIDNSLWPLGVEAGGCAHDHRDGMPACLMAARPNRGAVHGDHRGSRS